MAYNLLICLFFYLQLDKLRSLKMNDTMAIGNNFRPLQPLNSRTVKASFVEVSSTAPVPTEPGFGVNLNCSNAVLLLMLFGALFLR